MSGGNPLGSNGRDSSTPPISVARVQRSEVENTRLSGTGSLGSNGQQDMEEDEDVTLTQEEMEGIQQQLSASACDALPLGMTSSVLRHKGTHGYPPTPFSYDQTQPKRTLQQLRASACDVLPSGMTSSAWRQSGTHGFPPPPPLSLGVSSGVSGRLANDSLQTTDLGRLANRNEMTNSGRLASNTVRGADFQPSWDGPLFTEGWINP